MTEPSFASVQVFNEFANVAGRKLGLGADDIAAIPGDVARVHTVTPMAWESTRLALDVSKIGEGRNPDGSARPGNMRCRPRYSLPCGHSPQSKEDRAQSGRRTPEVTIAPEFAAGTSNDGQHLSVAAELECPLSAEA